MKKKLTSIFLVLTMLLTLIPAIGVSTSVAFADDGSGGSFTMERISDGTQKDVIVNGERRVIYCMQYDYLWPVTGGGYANAPTIYTEATTIDLLSADQQAIIQRVLYGGYPYDSVGILAPLYEYFDAASASDMASNLTQNLIWSLMVEWNIPGNTHFTPVLESSDSDIPGWDEAYNGLVDYALHGDPLPQASPEFAPEVIGSTTFTKHEEYWKTGALTISNPDGFKIMYSVTVPDDVVILDKDGYELSPNWNFVDGGWVNIGYTIYGGEPFYLQTEHGPSADGQSISFAGSARFLVNVKQYVTDDTGLGDKGDGQGYTQHKFQTMLSVGINSIDYSGSAVLSSAGETVTISGHKTWIHGDNPESMRPTSIVVHLHANGELKQTTTVYADELGNWTYSFADVPKYDENGVEIVYTIDEGYVHDYSASYQGYNITNTYVPGKTSINVEKSWNDNDDHDGLRPSSVTVKLFANSVDTGKTIILSDTNNWRGVFEDLLEKQNGDLIVYTVEEVLVPGYTTECVPQVDSEGNTTGFVITNTHENELVNVSGEKTWIHGDNPVENRPSSITVFLHADGVVKDAVIVTAENDWKWNFTDLNKYDHGTEIVYTVSEASIPNYIPSYNHSNYNITNTYAPEKTAVSVNKIWKDEHNRDGIRPENVTVHLLANLIPTGKTLTLSAENNWEDAFTGLNIFDAEGNRIHYSVTEDTVKGYHTAISGSEDAGYTITNTHEPETVEVNGRKTWDDENNQDSKRPTSITIHLLADGTIKDSVIVTEADGWAWSFTELHKYNQGAVIVYSVLEDSVDDYSTSYHGYNITNTYTPGKTSVSVEKRWLDDNNRDGKRPASIQVRLLADGVPADVSLLTLSEGNNWEGTFYELDEYSNGRRIIYTVEEVTTVNGYSSVVGGDASIGFVITNSYSTEVIDIPVRKVWDDENDKDGLRPGSVIIHILANGTVIKTVTIDESSNWEHFFTGLHKYENGAEITYTIEENAVTGYEPEITGNNDSGYIVTNKHTPAPRGSLVVSKTVLGNAADKNKAFTFTVTLNDSSVNGTYGDMNFVNGVATFTLKDGESKTATGLPNGTEYTVSESDYSAEGYETTKSGDEGVIVGDDTVTAAFTNTRNAEGSLTVSKTLAGNDVDKTKDFTFTITLNDTTVNGTYNGVTFTNGVATITLKDGESKTVEGLPNGAEYTVTETDYTADGYELTEKNGDKGTISEHEVSVAAFTNTRNTYGRLVVSKTVSGNAADKNMAFTFTVTLNDSSVNGTYGDMDFVNGVATFTLKDGESKTATGLPNGTEYTVSESDYSAEGYETTKSGDEGVIVGDDTVTAAFTNTRNVTLLSDDPQTPVMGENNNYVLWLMLFAISCLGLVMSEITLKKKIRR